VPPSGWDLDPSQQPANITNPDLTRIRHQPVLLPAPDAPASGQAAAVVVSDAADNGEGLRTQHIRRSAPLPEMGPVAVAFRPNVSA